MIIRKESGFTLVELMIGALLSLVVISSFLSVLGSYYQNRTVHLTRSYVQYNGGHAIRSISNALKYNFYEGCKIKDVKLRASSFGPPAEGVSSEIVGGPTPDFPIEDLVAQSLLGFDYDVGGNPQPAPPNALISAALVNLSPRPRPNSSVLISYNTSLETIETTVDMTSTTDPLTIDSNDLNLSQDQYAFVTDCFNASIFQVKNSPSTTIAHDPFTATYGAGSQVRRVYIDIFYVADSSRKDKGGNTVYSLYRSRNGVSQEIAEGINLLKLQYLEEMSTSTSKFVSATDGVNWPQVRGARVGLIATSLDLPLLEDDSKNYQILTETYMPRDLSGEFATKNYKQVFTSTVFLRNRG